MRERERERERQTEREREREKSNYSSSHSRIYLRQNVSHTAGRVPTDPTTLSCSWDNRSGRGETECARMTRTCA